MRHRLIAAASAVVLALVPFGVVASDAAAAEAYLANPPFSTRSAPVSTKTVDLAALSSAVLAGNYTSTIPAATRLRCPQSCDSTGIDPGNWYVYHSVSRLAQCESTMLLDFALFNNLDSLDNRVSIAACVADLNISSDNTSTTSNAECQASGASQTEMSSSLDIASSGSSSPEVSNVLAALAQLEAVINVSGPSCNEIIRFAYSGQAAVGVYIGSGLASQGMASTIVQQLREKVQNDSNVAENLLVQLCDESLSARYSLGIFASNGADLVSVQSAIQAWKNGSCITTLNEVTPTWQDVTFLGPSYASSNSTNSTSDNSTTLAADSYARLRKLVLRDDSDDCTTTQIVSGDTCTTLAAECGITSAEFDEYNSDSLCSTPLVVGQHVCCSSGSLPDYTPQPDADGYCYTYLIQTGDYCSSLAAAYDITIAEIESYNSDTWGWYGCDNLLAGYYMCLSSGYAPMPTTIANAVCGPQVNGTSKAPAGSDLSTLNECPLNACCDIWGQCGTTDEFCTESNSTTGAPGTAATGQNGCISNCGTDIIVSDAPSQVFSIAYFEGYDWQRPCLRPSIADLNTTSYTHVHYSFATLNSDFSINISSIEDQMPFLQSLSGVKRIVTIGGWDFSTSADTYQVFRDAVSSYANRVTLATNVADFLDEYDLDGIDWDWEYPDEPDIPGIPAGTEEDARGYYLLMLELKAKLSSDKTVSMTAPASYWYLQYFPIQAISEIIDYIVYMTYDLHGQWDYNNTNADPGCPTGGNCLRSHVNLTETTTALSMITKAGVPSNMVAVGVSSYGRSFKMTTADCWTEDCTYTGPDSGALAAPCTNTAGYISNYEIDLVLSENPSAQVYWDDTSYSNIVVYNDTEWVAYMNDTNKAVRTLVYEGLNFLGTADWAVDLQSSSDDSASSSSDSDSSANETVYVSPDIWSSDSLMVTASPGVTLVWPPMPLTTTTTISFPLWTTTVSYSSITTLTSTLTDGSTSTYPWYIYVSVLTVLTIPPVTTTAIPVWGISIDANSTDGAIYLTSSVQPDPFPITITPVFNGTTSIISATETTTDTGFVAIWGDYVYTQPDQTETVGGITTIIGGTTLAPVTTSVTPNPHPTTVPSTTDPALNSKKPSWTSGSPAKPTATPGCDGCGTACILFCDSDCPSCAPGVFGSDDDGEEESSSTTESSSSATEVATFLYGVEDDGDVFPTAYADAAELSSLYTAEESAWYSMNKITVATSTSPTTTSTSTSTTSTHTYSITPTAECEFWDYDYVAYYVEIYNIDGWSTDGGQGLEDNENGCGTVTEWDYQGPTDTTVGIVTFYIDFFIKSGCIERAIKSAGGPSISCEGGGVVLADKRRSEEERRALAASPEVPVPSAELREQLISVYGAPNYTHVDYVPMNWSTMAATTPTP